MSPDRSSRSLVLDVALALTMAAVAWYELLVRPLAEDVVGGPLWLNLVAASAGTLPLALRRRFPFGVALLLYAVLAGRALAAAPLEIYPTFLAALVATYTVASYASLRDAVLSAGFSGMAISVAVVRGSGTDATPDPLASAILFGTVWLVGRVVGVRNERAQLLHESRDQHAAEAVAAERERIARELHDAVSHSLAAIVLQAGGARNVLASDPDRAADSLATIERTARRGLEEMRRMLGLLGESDAALAPQPGLDRLPDLVQELADGGLDVELVVEGEPVAVPIGVDVSAYRIAQESLTNVLKHAGPCRTRVLLRYAADALTLEVADDGRGGRATTDGDGRGLAGMRERVQVLGGELEAGPVGSVGPGFRVRARLPLSAVPA